MTRTDTLTKGPHGWIALTEWRDNDRVNGIHVETFTQGGAPKSVCHTMHNLTHRWEYPHLLGYCLGFDVKASKRTVQAAHKEAVKRLQTIRPELP